MQVLEVGLRQGLLLVPLAVGVYLSFRVVRFPDLTPDGSFVLGACLTAHFMLSGVSPVLALVFGVLIAGLAGATTAVLAQFLRVDRVLSGIAVSLASYSIALRVLGSANRPVPRGVDALFNSGPSLTILVLGVIALSGAAVQTQFGLRLRAVGENPVLVSRLGGRVGLRITAGLYLSNCIVALSGGVFANYQRFADVSQGAGVLFIGLACLLIGGFIPGQRRGLIGAASAAAGALVYSVVVTIVLRFGLRPGDIKALTAVVVIIVAIAGSRLISDSERMPLF